MTEEEPAKRSRGNQTLYTPEIAEEILERLQNGELLSKICVGEGMPKESTVRMWAFDDYKGFAEPYARAREIGWHVIAEQAIEIADDGKNDTYVDEKGNTRTDHDVINRSRLRVDTRKWMLGKMLPKIYGDKLTLEGDMKVNSKSDEEIDARLDELIRKAGDVRPS